MLHIVGWVPKGGGVPCRIGNRERAWASISMGSKEVRAGLVVAERGGVDVVGAACSSL